MILQKDCSALQTFSTEDSEVDVQSEIYLRELDHMLILA